MRHSASEKLEIIRIIELALEQSELSPRELAVRFTDEKHYFVSEGTVYRLLRAHDLITACPAYAGFAGRYRYRAATCRRHQGYLELPLLISPIATRVSAAIPASQWQRP